MQSRTQKRLLLAVMLTGCTLLTSGCKTRDAASAIPSLPAAFITVKPGETVTYTAPADCKYAVITTDKGLLYLMGIDPEE